MAVVTICSDFEAPQNKSSHCLHCFPICLPWSEGLDPIILVFWMLSFKPTFSLSSFTFIKSLFSSSSLSAIRVVSSAYLRLLIFPPPGNLESSLCLVGKTYKYLYVVSNSLWPRGLYSPWNSAGQNTEVGRLSLFQGIFLTQESNWGSPALQADSVSTELSGKLSFT